MEFKDYLDIFRRRWWWLPALLILFGVSHEVFVYRQPQRYRAHAKIIINLERYEAWNLTDLRPDTWLFANTGQPGETVWDKAVIEWAAELLRGDRDFRSAVFDAAEAPEKFAELQEYRQRFGAVDQADLMALIQASISTRARAGSEIQDVYAVSADATSGRAMADAVAEAAAQFHKEQATRLLNRQKADVDDKWEEAIARLRRNGEELTRYITENGVHSIDEKTRLVLQTLSALEGQKENIRANISKNLEAIQYEQAEQVEATVRAANVDFAALESPQVSTLKRRLLEGQMELDALLNGFPARTEDHPQVVALQKRLRGQQEELDRAIEVLVDQKGFDFDRRMRDLAKANVLFNVELKIIDARMAEKNAELARLSRIRTEFLSYEEKFKRAQEEVSELTDLRKVLDRTLRVVEGPIVVFGTARPDEVQTVPRTGEGNQALILTLIMATLLSVGAMFFSEMLDTRIATEYDIRRHLNLPLLGVVTHQGGGEVLLSNLPSLSPMAEEFLTLATLIEVSMQEQGLKSLMVCSANPKEGKTTVATNLAIAMARKGFDTVLIDADMRLPEVHRVLGLPNRSGLGDLLKAEVPRVKTALVDSMIEDAGAAAGEPDLERFMQDSSVPNLRVITSGSGAQDPVSLLSSGYVRQVLDDLKANSDFVVFDTPPITQVSDALSLAIIADGCLLVVGSRLCDQHEVSWTKHLLNNVNAKIIGVLLTMATKRRRQDYYYYYSEEAKSLRQ